MKKDACLYNSIKGTIWEKEPPLEALNNLIDEEISSAVPITFDDLATLDPKDGDNFVISIEQDTASDLKPVVFDGKTIIITIRGSGKLVDAVEAVLFSHKEDEPLFKIGKGTVLILENIALMTNSFILDCVIKLSGGILVFKHSMIVNFMIRVGTHQRLSSEPGFITGDSVNGLCCDVISANGEGIVYYY